MYSFPEIKGHFGFGTLRLPKNGNSINYEELNRMVDCFLGNGFNYFDMAHGYMGGQCETAIRKAVVERYPRDRYVLTDKLTWEYFKKEADILPFFEQQLRDCGVEYFDFYFLHALTRKKFEKFNNCHAFEILSRLKREGKIHHIGISFHDKPDFLEELLSRYPQIELVQIQFNYVDYEAPSVESRKVYEVCKAFGKPVSVMEPVKGGSLVRLPADAQDIFDRLNEKNHTANSNASYALRFASSFEQITMVLSGMSTLEQVEENVQMMKGLQPLSDEEHAAIRQVRELFNSKQLIQCTGCRYCTDGCPRHILIPDLFSCLNQKRVFNTWNQEYYYRNVLTSHNGKASDCIKCGRCEASCPQRLKIRDLLVDVANEFEVKIRDIPLSSPDYKHAIWAVENGVTYLDPNHNFIPSGGVRRLDIIVFLWRMAGRPTDHTWNAAITDIPVDYKFRDAIQWALAGQVTYLDANSGQTA